MKLLKIARPISVLTASAVAALVAGALVGCASTPADKAPEATQPTLVDGWVKAHDSMTGIFGTLTNPSGDDVTLIDASSTVAGMVEMHETVVNSGNMIMQEKEGGFSIAAGGSFELEPGGDHIMLMDLARELLPGEDIDITLVFSDGTETTLNIPVREYAGAIEEYAPGDHDEHSHDEHSHDEHEH